MSFDPAQDVDYTEHAAYKPCPDCGGGDAADGEHLDGCATFARLRTIYNLAALPTRTTDRYGRPLAADPEARRVETNPVGVHILPMTWDRYALADLDAGAGIDWTHRGAWRTDHVLHVPLRDGDRWIVGYEDDTAIVNHGPGAPRTRGRSLWAFADSSCISAHPGMGTAGDIARWKAAGQWHEAAMGDLVILQCFDPSGALVETVAARIVPDGFRGSHMTLRLVERDA